VRIPTAFVPPYHGGRGPASASATTPTTDQVPYVLSLNIEIDSSSPITRLISPSHDISTRFALNNRKAWVTLSEGVDVPDRDIVVLYRSESIESPQLVLQKSPLYDTYALMLSFLPFAQSLHKSGLDTSRDARYYDPAAYLNAKAEFVFLIDCSGSMMGRIQQAREAAKIFIKSLPHDSYFSFVFFGSNYRVAAPGHSVKYTKETMEQAWRYLDSLDADMGGTELYAALKYVLGLPLIGGYQRNVLLMTDGEVTNPDEVIKMVRELTGSSGAYVHSIGIGSGASRHLVQGVAQAGKGSSYFISGTEAIMPKVVEALSNMCMKRVHSLRVKWPGNEEPVVSYVPSVGHYGQPVVATAIFDKKPVGKLVVSGYTSDDGKYFEQSFEVNSMDQREGESAYRLAVKMALNGGSVQDTEKVKTLSLTYSVLSDATAFVAVKLYTDRVDRRQTEQVRIPVMSVREQRRACMEGMPTFGAPRMNVDVASAKMAAAPMYYGAESASADQADAAENDILLIDVDDSGRVIPPTHTKKAQADKSKELMELLSLQEPDGSFTLNANILSKHLSSSLQTLKQELAANSNYKLSTVTDDKTLSTILVLYILDEQFAAAAEVALVRVKAVSWLKGKGIDYDVAKGEIATVLQNSDAGLKVDL